MLEFRRVSRVFPSGPVDLAGKSEGQSGKSASLRWGALLALGWAAALFALPSEAGVLVLPAVRDNTLIESPDGSLSNGAGPSLFVGRTSQEAGSVRRALLAFDVAGALPPGALVTGVALALHASQTNGGPAALNLHRVLADWGEGSSWWDGGRGAPAAPGDATWLHRFYADAAWSAPGGDFAAGASASATVDAPGPYLWSSPQMAADVQAWLDDSASDFGWVLLGDEAAASTVKRFDSRENTPDLAPVLRVEFQAAASGACGDAGLGGAALGLCTAYCEALDCDGDAPRAPPATCARLEGLFREKSGEERLPCQEGPGGPICPCFEVTDVAALILTLEDQSTYTGLSCIDTRISAKPLTSVRAVRVDGADCSTSGAEDCSAVAFEFTEDNICQLNLPAPQPSVDIQGISDEERAVCRQHILDAAAGLGLRCD